MVRYVNPANHYPARIAKADKYLAKRLDFKDIKLPVKIRDIHKFEKKKFIGISVFDYENKHKTSNLCTKIFFKEKHVDLLLIGKEKKLYDFIKDFSKLMYDHSLNRTWKKTFLSLLFTCFH